MIVGTMGALLSLLGYGLTAAVVGFAFAYRERNKRRTQATDQTGTIVSVLRRAEHARLRTDAGEEVEVFLTTAR